MGEGNGFMGKGSESDNEVTALLWRELVARQGEIFYTAKGLPFTYSVRGGEMFVDRRSKSITRATFQKAVEKLLSDEKHEITGPKSLNCFGAPYIWALLQALGMPGQANH